MPIVGPILFHPISLLDVCILDSSLNVKPINEWDMSFTSEIQSLANQYERGQMSAYDLFSSTVREASMTQYRHFQGEVNAVTKVDEHYHGLFGFQLLKTDIWAKSPSPAYSLRIKRAVGGCMQEPSVFQIFLSV